jgi:hypothetical protein
MSWGHRVAQEYGGNGEGLGGLKGGHRGRIGERACPRIMGGFYGGNRRVDGRRRKMTWGPTHQREKKKRGERCCALLGLLGGLAGPRARAGFGPVSFFFSFILFCFCFLFIFCNLAPIRFKQLCKFF